MSKSEPTVIGQDAAAAACCSPMVREPLDETAAVDLARMFKALADPVRLRLLSLIASFEGGEACVCDLTGPFDVSQPTISHNSLRQTGGALAVALFGGLLTGPAGAFSLPGMRLSLLAVAALLVATTALSRLLLPRG